MYKTVHVKVVSHWRSSKENLNCHHHHRKWFRILKQVSLYFELCWQRSRKNKEKQEYFKYYQSYIHNDVYSLNKLYFDLYNIQSSVEKIRSKIIFLYFDNWYLPSPILNKINFVKFGNELSCLNWAISNELTYSKKDLHLSEDGNKILSQHISKGHSKG